MVSSEPLMRWCRSSERFEGTIRSLSPLAMRVGWVSLDRSSGVPRPHFLIAFNCVWSAFSLIGASRSTVRSLSRLTNARVPVVQVRGQVNEEEHRDAALRAELAVRVGDAAGGDGTLRGLRIRSDDTFVRDVGRCVLGCGARSHGSPFRAKCYNEVTRYYNHVIERVSRTRR